MLQKTILDLEAQEALFFFLDSKIYCSLDFPPYIAFGSLLNTINEFLSNNPDILKRAHPDNYENVNYIIAANKD